jgi:hypothetical protein
MEDRGIYRELLHCRQPFPCFTRGCPRQAVNLARFMTGQVVVQVCLCDECLAKPAESILEGLRREPEKFQGGIPTLTRHENPRSEVAVSHSEARL